MSVIGPRPGLWNQDILTAERDKYNANDVKPGLTGWAQINGRDELEIPVKAKLDGEYVEKLGLLMDIKCFLGSIGVFAHDDSVVEGGTGEIAKNEMKKDSENLKKKILVICQYYKPEPFRISDICEEMVRRGQEEKVAVAKSRMSGKTKICCTRYGNVMCSRGSVIPLWIDQIKAGNPITLTEPSMTRFIMSLEEAVDLVLFAFEHGENGDLLIQKAPACTIQTQAEAVCELFGGKKEDIKVIGIRHGEKMYETLLTNEECAKAVDMGNFYRVPADNRGLNYDKYFKDGDNKRNTLTEFNSNNTTRLNLEETKAKIAALAYIQEELEKME